MPNILKLEASLIKAFLDGGDTIDALDKVFADIVTEMKDYADYVSEKITIEIENDFEHEEEEDSD